MTFADHDAAWRSDRRSDRHAALQAALRDVRHVVAVTRSELARVQSRPTTTPEERRALQEQALDGALGPDMQRLARQVQAGGTSWPEVFEGISPSSDLLREHLDRMLAEHRDGVRRALEADRAFDPRAAHEDVVR